MKKMRWARKISASLLATGMVLALASPALAAEAPIGLPGDPDAGYVSLHQYIYPTDEENVFRVTLSIKGVPRQMYDETRVAIVVDNSASMNLDAEQWSWMTGAIMFNSYDMATEAVQSGDTSSLASMLVSADTQLIGYPRYMSPMGSSSMFSSIVGTTTNQYAPDPRYGTKFSPTPNMAGNQSEIARFPTYLVDSANYNTVWLRAANNSSDKTKPANYPTGKDNTTRLEAAVKGAEEAIEVFLDPTVNPSSTTTSVGLVAFNTGEADQQSAFDIQTYLLLSGLQTYGFGDTISPNTTAITYSSRYTVGGAVDTALTTFGGAPGAALSNFHSTRPLVTYLNPLKLDTTTLINPTPKNPLVVTTVGDLATSGLVTTAGKDKLIDGIKSDIYHSTLTPGTPILYSLEEAEKMLFTGGAASGTIDSQTGINIDGTRRFIIFLSDCGDSLPPYTTFDKIDALKAAGVEFMVIGIDVENAGQNSSQLGTGTAALPGGVASVPIIGNSNEGDGQYAVWMSTKLTSYSSTAYTSWADVQAQYTAANWSGEMPDYTYVSPTATNMADQIVQALKDYATKIIEFGSGAKADIKLNSSFEIYKFPGKPLYELNDPKGVGTVTITGNQINWSLNSGVPLQNETSLSFYVKLDPTQAGSGYVSPLSSATFYCNGPFATASNPTGINDVDIFQVWPSAYVNSKGDVKNDSSSSNGSSSGGSSMDKYNNSSSYNSSGSSGSSGTGSGLIPISGSSSNTAYTPSVTPVQRNATEEALISGIKKDEVAEATEEVPVTSSTSSNVVIAAVLLCAAATAFAYFKMKSVRDDR